MFANESHVRRGYRTTSPPCFKTDEGCDRTVAQSKTGRELRPSPPLVLRGENNGLKSNAASRSFQLWEVRPQKSSSNVTGVQTRDVSWKDMDNTCSCSGDKSRSDQLL